MSEQGSSLSDICRRDGMVDMPDSKSGALWVCRFESDRRYQFIDTIQFAIAEVDRFGVFEGYAGSAGGADFSGDGHQFCVDALFCYFIIICHSSEVAVKCGDIFVHCFTVAFLLIKFFFIDECVVYGDK